MAGITGEDSPGGLFGGGSGDATTTATAEQSQIAAAASETAAAASATTASTKASEASTSATNAASSATTASGHATTATTRLAASKEAFNNNMQILEYGNKVDRLRETSDKNTTKAIENIEDQLEAKLEIEPEYFTNMAKNLLNEPGFTPFTNDFNGDSTGKALTELTRMFIRAKGPDGKALFNGLLDAETEAKNVLRNSNPEATTLWGPDKLNTKSDDPNSLYNLASRVIKSRGGVQGVQSGRVAAEIPENLTKIEIEAWNDAQARLAKDPKDANSLKVIELLSN